MIDAHVHFNEPGRTDWEGWATGTRALAAGGATACVEMPLNAHPPTVDGAAFDAKVAAARASALVDFALWGGLVPGDLDRLDELAERGVVGFKAFMCDSGIDDFPAADDDVLGAGMLRAAALGLPVAVHAERPSALREPAGTTWRDFVASRPVAAELEAIERALALAARDRLRAARRARQQRRRRRARRRRARPRGRRHLRDLPALPHAHRGRPRDARRAREVRAAAAHGRRARRAVGAPRRRADRVRRLRPLALPAGHEGGRLHGGLGRHRGLPVAARAPARRAAPAAADDRRADVGERRGQAARCPRRDSSRAPTPTWCSSTSATATPPSCTTAIA